MLTILVQNFAIMLAIFFGVWLVSVAIKDASIVDILWGPSLAVPALLTYFLQGGAGPRAVLLTVLVSVWAFRLGGYLAIRNLGHGEDFRYQAMRQKAGSDGAFARQSLIRVYFLQCVISFFVSLPVQVGQFDAHPFFGQGAMALGPLALFGAALFAIGLGFEAIGDAQLRAFKRDPANKGKLMDRGLWAWTRHPNYFGDSAVWFGLFLIALESRSGYLTVLSPVIMFIFLYFLSGKGLLEKLMARKYPGYEAYKARVSGFFPWPPKPSS
ncbi:MAG: DUF1295 domain-containing protein [Pseudomonadota bacterium]